MGADASMEQLLALAAKAKLLGVDEQRLAHAQQACANRNTAAVAALQAAAQGSPFSMDIFRLRLLDAKRLCLAAEAQAAQGETTVGANESHLACQRAVSLDYIWAS